MEMLSPPAYFSGVNINEIIKQRVSYITNKKIQIIGLTYFKDIQQCAPVVED